VHQGYDRPVETVTLLVEELRVGSRVVLSLAGEVDLASVAILDRAVQRLRNCDAAEVWIDLTRVGFIDSTGLSVLVAARRALIPDRQLVLICPTGAALHVIEVAGLDRIFTIRPDRAAAHAG
jgi:anti-sigma B factor antagonist